MIARILIFAAAWLTALSGMAAGYVTETDIPYSANMDDYSRERCKLDVYYPESQTDVPVVVWFHGGGLTGGGKHIPDELRDCGYAVVAVNYRLLPNVPVQDCIDDAAAAVAWTFKNAGRYNGSRHKVFVTGHSAGGYLTSMVGLDRRYLAKYGIDADSIAGLIPFSGQAITHYAHRDMQGVGPLAPRLDEYAPLFHVRADSAPYIIITGDREQELFGRYEENAYLWRMLRLVGHPDVNLYEIDGHDHGAMAHPAFHILKKEMNRLLGKR